MLEYYRLIVVQSVRLCLHISRTVEQRWLVAPLSRTPYGSVTAGKSEGLTSVFTCSTYLHRHIGLFFRPAATKIRCLPPGGEGWALTLKPTLVHSCSPLPKRLLSPRLKGDSFCLSASCCVPPWSAADTGRRRLNHPQSQTENESVTSEGQGRRSRREGRQAWT